jgi:hypothetical protein
MRRPADEGRRRQHEQHGTTVDFSTPRAHPRASPRRAAPTRPEASRTSNAASGRITGACQTSQIAAPPRQAARISSARTSTQASSRSSEKPPLPLSPPLLPTPPVSRMVGTSSTELSNVPLAPPPPD